MSAGGGLSGGGASWSGDDGLDEDFVSLVVWGTGTRLGCSVPGMFDTGKDIKMTVSEGSVGGVVGLSNETILMGFVASVA